MSKNKKPTQIVAASETLVEGVLVETAEVLEPVEGVLVESNEAFDAATPIIEAKLSTAELKVAYAVIKNEAMAAHDPAAGKFVFSPTWPEYKTQYNIQWELAHPNDKDALVLNTDTVLAVVDDAIDATSTALVVAKAEGAPSKMSLAKAIFDAELAAKGVAGLSRKDILKRFVEEAGCTRAGANTYYNTVRDKAGLVNHK